MNTFQKWTLNRGTWEETDTMGHIREIDDEKETDGAKNKELKDGDRYEIPRSIRITQKLKSKKQKIINSRKNSWNKKI